MQKLVQLRQIPPNRLVLESQYCECCGEAATIEMSIELEHVIAVHRYCESCLPATQY